MVIEIGPGRGALTEALLERAKRVIAIEVDPVLVHYLRQKFLVAIEAGQLLLIEGDILKADLMAAGGGQRAAVAGNLPYYITSPILERVLQLKATWSRAVFMMQAEVAARVAAAPGSRDFGYLSVLVQCQSHVEPLFDVPRDAFRPPPKVESAVIRLTPRDEQNEFGVDDLPAFLAFARACFRQKRKTLRNNLAPMFGEKIEGLKEARLRAEQLSVAEIAELFHKLRALPE